MTQHPTQDSQSELRNAIEAYKRYPYGTKEYPHITGIELLEVVEAYVTTRVKEAERLASEVFVPVRGYEGLYEVSNKGRVKSIARHRSKGGILKQSNRYKTYKCVTLSKDNVRVMANVHRLVAENFISNPEAKRTVNHKDGDPSNNGVENLEWATYSENERHARLNGKLVWNSPRRIKALTTTTNKVEQKPLQRKQGQV